jgi:hypothetical protein
MKTLLFLGLLITLLVYAWKIISWVITYVRFFKKNEKVLEIIKIFYGTKTPKMQIFLLYIALLEHLIIFSSVLAATLIIF